MRYHRHDQLKQTKQFLLVFFSLINKKKQDFEIYFPIQKS